MKYNVLKPSEQTDPKRYILFFSFGLYFMIQIHSAKTLTSALKPGHQG